MVIFVVILIGVPFAAFCIAQFIVIRRSEHTIDDTTQPRATRDSVHAYAKDRQQVTWHEQRIRKREIRDLERAFRR